MTTTNKNSTDLRNEAVDFDGKPHAFLLVREVTDYDTQYIAVRILGDLDEAAITLDIANSMVGDFEESKIGVQILPYGLGEFQVFKN